MKKRLSWSFCALLLSAICVPHLGAQDISTNNIPIGVTNTKTPLVIKGLYGNRSKSALRSRYDGSSATENAVMRCLRWLKNVQNEDGSWGGAEEPTTEATGLALLTFLAHGETPASNEFGNSVERALRYLLSIQNEDGTFKAKAQFPASEHGIVTWAVCEAYALTRIILLSDMSGKAIDVIIQAQKPSGMWNADYSKDNGADDVEASVWQILALKSAYMAGLKQVELRPVLQASRKAIALTIEPGISGKTSAPAIYCEQIMGYGDDRVTRLGLKALEGLTMNWEAPGYDNPIYQWHFIHLANFSEGGKLWVEWNRICAPTLVTNQIVESAKDEKECGYWISPGKNERYGKIYSTTLCCMMLECYYRYLPSFCRPERSPEERNPTNDIVIKVP